jgi:hypothetical protein
VAVAANEPQIGPFLIKLSEDPALLEQYLQDPAGFVDDYPDLTDDKKEILRSGNLGTIIQELRREYPDEAVKSDFWRPIRFPLPFGMHGPVHVSGD